MPLVTTRRYNFHEYDGEYFDSKPQEVLRSADDLNKHKSSPARVHGMVNFKKDAIALASFGILESSLLIKFPEAKIKLKNAPSLEHYPLMVRCIDFPHERHGRVSPRGNLAETRRCVIWLQEFKILLYRNPWGVSRTMLVPLLVWAIHSENPYEKLTV